MTAPPPKRRRVERLNRPLRSGGYPLLKNGELKLDPEASQLLDRIESLEN